MALKYGAPFPIFPPNVSIPHRRSSIPTEIRFSRWNNANAEPFLRRKRRQKEIEDDIRWHRRYDSATKIVEDFDAAERTSTDSSFPLRQEYKSTGTPSAPSSPSIPGKFSKYSKPPKSSSFSHPAFRRIAKAPPKSRVPPPAPDGESGILFSDKGISYRLKDAPFEFQYSYTETPKVKPLALREPPFLPFGPTTMPRPWTGRAPIGPSKKKLPEFDSFRPPPAGKKGVKTVQSPGPFLAGSGPKYTASTREEILGEPLTKEEIKALIQGCLKCKRQLNMGRDGFTHNMLDNIHAHWKRRRVCKIKCKGVCTVDMDNVRQQLEEKTGGKIIGGKGGVIFLYRGRNYNYRTRPRFPLMLWKPITPVYPRLVQRAPEGLTLEEAMEMRKKGRLLPPICKLGKNGLYANLVKNVQEAFEECELVRINCKGLNKSDCRKIGAKLRDLVPCVLVSFEHEHILMWRGKDWKSSLASSQDACREATEQVAVVSSDTSACDQSVEENMNPTEDIGTKDSSGLQKMDPLEVEPTALSIIAVVTENFESSATINQELPSSSSSDGTVHSIVESGSASLLGKDMVDTNLPWMEEVMLLVKQAVEKGSAEVLEDEYLDADAVLERSMALAKRAPVCPTFQHQSKKATTQKAKKEKNESIEEKIEENDDVVDALVVSQEEGDGRRKSRSRKTERTFLDVVPHGSLRVDELAKLLA